MDKIKLLHNGKAFGSVALFDCEPSFELIHAVFPGPLEITHDVRSRTWFVDLKDQPAPMLAD
jgi:hypothetical protein